MVLGFNADEVFEMAIRAEQNGAAFYRRAAELNAGKSTVEFLEKLAAIEDAHEKVFAHMRKDLSGREKGQTVYDRYDDGALYLAATADTHGGEGSPSVADTLTGEETMEQILQIAIELEQKSILFYVGLRDLVPENLGRDRVDTIIEEEKGHVAALMREMERVKAEA
jgi:rubrerythrin